MAEQPPNKKRRRRKLSARNGPPTPPPAPAPPVREGPGAPVEPLPAPVEPLPAPVEHVPADPGVEAAVAPGLPGAPAAPAAAPRGHRRERGPPVLPLHYRTIPCETCGNDAGQIKYCPHWRDPASWNLRVWGRVNGRWGSKKPLRTVLQVNDERTEAWARQWVQDHRTCCHEPT